MLRYEPFGNNHHVRHQYGRGGSQAWVLKLRCVTSATRNSSGSYEMALISIFRCITLAALVLLGEAQSRVITTDFNATGLSLEGQGGALAMRRFKDDHRMSQKALLTDEDLQNRLLESESEDDDRESIVDLILSQEQNPSHPYLQFLNEHGGAARVFNSSSEIPTESGGAGDDTEHNESDDEQRSSATEAEAGRIMLSVTRDSRTKKIDLKRFKETVQRNVSKLLHNDHNRIHPQKKKFSGFRTQPRFRNRTKRQIELYMYNINHNDTDRRKRHRKMRMQTVCSALTGKEEIAPNPLMCYQCESYSSEKEPRCDVVLWNYLRESEKHYIR